MEAAVKSMRVGGIRRVIIPPSQGYQNTSQEPIPPNVSFVLQTSSEKKEVLCYQEFQTCYFTLLVLS